MPSRLANSWSDRARPVASSSNHVRPRAIALISAGSHRDLSICCASAGSTSLVSAPRRLKATAAASSTALSRPSSDADAGTPPSNSGPHRSLMVSDWSSTATFSTSPRTSFASFPEWIAERCCETSRPAEHLPNLITGHAGCIKPLDQLRRARQAFDQNSDHGFFDLPGTEPPALGAIGSGLGDQRGGDVVAIAPAFLDGV